MTSDPRKIALCSERQHSTVVLHRFMPSAQWHAWENIFLRSLRSSEFLRSDIKTLRIIKSELKQVCPHGHTQACGHACYATLSRANAVRTAQRCRSLLSLSNIRGRLHMTRQVNSSLKRALRFELHHEPSFLYRKDLLSFYISHVKVCVITRNKNIR